MSHLNDVPPQERAGGKPLADAMQSLQHRSCGITQALIPFPMGMDALLKYAFPLNWEKPEPLANAVLARAFTPLQLHPHRLFKCREFWSGFIEHFEGARLRIPDVPSSPIEFVKGHNYQLGVTNKLKIPIVSNCIKWHMLNTTCE